MKIRRDNPWILPFLFWGVSTSLNKKKIIPSLHWKHLWELSLWDGFDRDPTKHQKKKKKKESNFGNDLLGHKNPELREEENFPPNFFLGMSS